MYFDKNKYGYEVFHTFDGRLVPLIKEALEKTTYVHSIRYFNGGGWLDSWVEERRPVRFRIREMHPGQWSVMVTAVKACDAAQSAIDTALHNLFPVGARVKVTHDIWEWGPKHRTLKAGTLATVTGRDHGCFKLNWGEEDDWTIGTGFVGFAI